MSSSVQRLQYVCQFQGTLYCKCTVNKPNCIRKKKQTALQSRTVHRLNETAVTDKLFLDWMTIQLQTVHELTNAAAISDFMDWMTLQSQTDCSWTELWHCSHKQTFHELNDTAVTNRLFMDCVMTLQSHTDCSWNEWHCGHKLLMDWMTLQSHTVHWLNDAAVTNRLFMDWIMTLQSQRDYSWTQWWQCSHRQTIHGLTNAAATSDFMDWMMFPKHILSITHKIWDLRFSQQYC